jgi:hypothetical protein
MSYAQRSKSWSESWLQSASIALDQRPHQARMRKSWLILIAGLFVLTLSGCVSPQQCLPAKAPSELLVPPPPPGAMQDRLEQILSQGQTSGQP